MKRSHSVCFAWRKWQREGGFNGVDMFSKILPKPFSADTNWGRVVGRRIRVNNYRGGRVLVQCRRFGVANYHFEITPQATSKKLNPDSISKSNSFNKLGLSGQFDAIFHEFGIQEPTKAQTEIIPKLATLRSGTRGRREDGSRETEIRHNVIVAAETGSGKTLAYLLPLMELLKRDEGKLGFETRKARPRVLVLSPTRELAIQIGKVAKKFSHGSKLRVACLTGGMVRKKQNQLLDQPMDILISTASRSLYLRDVDQKLFLGSVRHLVVDEADVIAGAGDDFRTDLSSLIEPMETYGMLLNKIWVGATVINTTSRKLAERRKLAYGRDKRTSTGIQWIRSRANAKKETLEVVKSSHHGYLPKGLVYEVRVGSETSKHPCLLSVFRGANYQNQIDPESGLVRPLTRTIIFCNSLSSCRSTCYTLEENSELDSTTVFSINGEMPPKMRAQQLDAFLSENQSSQIAFGEAKTEHKVLVCTDIAARGLDFNLGVDHVIMFDLPSSISDFIHRIGRTARGSEGHGKVSLISRGSHHDERAINLLLAAVPTAEAATMKDDRDLEKQFVEDLTRYKHYNMKHSTKHARLKKRTIGTKFVAHRKEETHPENFQKIIENDPIQYPA